MPLVSTVTSYVNPSAIAEPTAPNSKARRRMVVLNILVEAPYKAPAYTAGVNVIFVMEGSVYEIVIDAVCPADRLVIEGSVMYGLPLKVPVGFTSVTPDGRPVRTTLKGPATVLEPAFLMVTVPLNNLVTRL